jgi:DNA-binding NarL/FixJ family response regulator
VDDDGPLLTAIGAILRHHGFEVECHGSAPGALDALARRPFDLIVTDLHLPGQSGIELLRRVTETAPGTTAIVITGEPTVDSAVEALRLAAVDYLVKPFDPRDLVARVRTGVEKTRARRQVSDARERVEELGRMLGALQSALDGASAPEAPAPSPAPRAAGRLRGLSEAERSALSARELEVLEALVEGKSPKEIAAALFISQHTARNHLRSIYAKLGVHSQLELLRKVVG